MPDGKGPELGIAVVGSNDRHELAHSILLGGR